MTKEEKGVQVKDANKVEVLDGADYGKIVMERNRAMRDGANKASREVNQYTYDSGVVKFDRVEYKTRGAKGNGGKLLATKTYVRGVEKYENGERRFISGGK
jgi:hypothetical protein